jgi:multidrug efflux pump subunit AcrA (membrane-fusion protein)
MPVGGGGELSLTAPFDGTITAVRAAAGQTVAAGSPIAEIAQMETLWVRVPLFAGDAASVDAARPASVTALGRETSGPWREARRVAGPPTADAGAASVDLFYELSPAGPIRPGERLAVRLTLSRAASGPAIVIPASAVVYDLSGGT